MEHWMTQGSSIYALLELSESSAPFSDDEIEAALAHQSRDKCLQVSQQLNDGELELQLFSAKPDLQQDSILALQRDVASRCAPHDVESSTSADLDALAEIFREVSARGHGHALSGYRYLLGDVVSANLFRALQQEQTGNGAKAPSAAAARVRTEVVRTLTAAADSLPDALLNPAGLFNLYRIDDRKI
jgi:Zn-dependent oligopeptidase